MQNPRLATRYAKSLLDLAVERNSVDAALNDMQVLNELCGMSHEFLVMLRSPVINGDKKLAVIDIIMKRCNVSAITYAFIKLLVAKGREMNLPEIAAAFITQYNELKNIKVVKLTTAAPMADTIKTSIQEKVAAYMPGDTVDLKMLINEGLIGGFVLEVEDKLYDASVRKSLNEIKANIIDTSYVAKI